MGPEEWVRQEGRGCGGTLGGTRGASPRRRVTRRDCHPLLFALDCRGHVL